MVWGFRHLSFALFNRSPHSSAVTGSISSATGLSPPAIIHAAWQRKLLSPLNADLADRCTLHSLAAKSWLILSACCRRNSACLVAPKGGLTSVKAPTAP